MWGVKKDLVLGAMNGVGGWLVFDCTSVFMVMCIYENQPNWTVK